MTKRELAISNFKQGYNCSQSLVLTFKDIIPQYEQLMKIASPFGGGMGRMRETCGAVSAMVLIVGSIEGYSSPETGEIKTVLYKNIQVLLRKFEEKYGNLTCRDLRKLSTLHDEPTPEKRTKVFYKTRPCCELIGGAAEILEEYLKKYERKE